MKLLTIKLLAFGLFLSFLSVPATAQEWLTDYDQAITKAKAENKHILVFFTGSDWCSPCKRIKSEVYTSEAFISFANEKLILLMADFPKRPENKLSEEQESKNKALARVFNPRGFPTSILINTDGKELDRWVGYDPSGVDSYLQNFAAAMN